MEADTEIPRDRCRPADQCRTLCPFACPFSDESAQVCLVRSWARGADRRDHDAPNQRLPLNNRRGRPRRHGRNLHSERRGPHARGSDGRPGRGWKLERAECHSRPAGHGCRQGAPFRQQPGRRAVVVGAGMGCGENPVTRGEIQKLHAPPDAGPAIAAAVMAASSPARSVPSRRSTGVAPNILPSSAAAAAVRGSAARGAP